jgi:DNA-binding MarR family transcriptional regulator
MATEDAGSVWGVLLSAHGRVTDRIDRDLNDECSMSLAEFEVLDHLVGAPGHALRMNELADLVRLSPSGLTRRFDTLVRRGWVVREPCSDDRRGINARLTGTGHDVHRGARGVHQRGVQHYLLDHLDDLQRRCLLDALGAVTEANAQGAAKTLEVARVTHA